VALDPGGSGVDHMVMDPKPGAGATALSVDDLARLTPASRDRFMDFLRAASITAVVFGHWFISIIWWQAGLIRNTSAVGVTRGLWLGTWALQVMPIFFFVGGFSNMVAYDAFRRRGDSTWAFVRSRIERLVRPSLVFLGIWAMIQVALHLADVGSPTGPRLWGHTDLLRGMRPPGATIPFGPVWFLGVYLVVVCLAPLTIRLHRRFPLWVPATMIAGAVAADLIGFVGGHSAVRWFNVAFVLLLPHQIGHFYADGTLQRQSRRFHWLMVAVGLGMLLILTNPPLFELFGNVRFRWFPGIGYYPKSLLGTDVERVSNAYPPTLCYLFAGIWAIGAVMLLRPTLTRWLQRVRGWKLTIAVNGMVMTLFLWHMTAYLLVILALWPLGFGRQHGGTARWWLERPLWIGAPALVLAGLVAIFARFEHPRRRAPAR
jgi:fucose 4-O-acetylase-like acetyltransferase